MKNLKTNYMGIEIDNPIVVGASNLITKVDKLKMAEENGAAAIVYKSLFEEQIQLERLELDEELNEFNDISAEIQNVHPHFEHAGATEHLINLRNAKESVSVPVIASLNAVNNQTWIEYAKLISQTGVDGIELNLYLNSWDMDKDSNHIENEQIRIVKEIKESITIPLSVKLSSDYTNSMQFIAKLDKVGVNTFVLFNSFFEPDIDIEKVQHIKKFNFSHEGDYKKSLRFAGLLFNNIKADICCTHGVFTGADAIKLLLSGASSVQVVSALYQNGFSQIAKMKTEISNWMEEKNYNSIDEFKGLLSKSKLNNDPFIYKRGQYVDLLMNAEEVFGIK
ncbi:MAG TPA: dihydroorotate dehydrogenase-like protein [Paludibacter sp.]|nr:dihydroorotate dehydrogenase-like protein [Paludibacter sp.]